MAKIIIKADDLRATSNERWTRFANLCIDLDIPATVGFIAGDVGSGLPVDDELVSLMKQPRFQIWNHSYDHRIEKNGSTDFYGAALDKQLGNITKTQAIASNLFGEAPRGFGAPYNKYDANTLKVLNMVDCFDFAFDVCYLPGLKTIPKALYVECEGPMNGRTFGLELAIKKSQAFMLRRLNFVLQIHPGNHWGEDCIDRFGEYVRYAKASGYEFGQIDSTYC